MLLGFILCFELVWFLPCTRVKKLFLIKPDPLGFLGVILSFIDFDWVLMGLSY